MIFGPALDGDALSALFAAALAVDFVHVGTLHPSRAIATARSAFEQRRLFAPNGPCVVYAGAVSGV